MPKVVITHGVADVQSWLGFKAERAQALGGLGGTDIVDYVASDGSNAAAVTAVMADLDAALAVIAAPPPELTAEMDRHGVMPPIVVYVER